MDGTRFELNGLLVVVKGVVLNVKRCGWRGRHAGLWLKGINLAKKEEASGQHDRSTVHRSKGRLQYLTVSLLLLFIYLFFIIMDLNTVLLLINIRKRESGHSASAPGDERR